MSCCCYHKGTYFQANHNSFFFFCFFSFVVVATTKVHIFKQITTTLYPQNRVRKLLLLPQRYIFSSKSQLALHSESTDLRCCCYHKGTYFQANHNYCSSILWRSRLLLLPQRYIFSSKSQLLLCLLLSLYGCCCYHKGTYFQANHNSFRLQDSSF